MVKNFLKQENLSKLLDGQFKSPKAEVASRNIVETTSGMWDAHLDITVDYTKIENGTPSLATMRGIPSETSFYGDELHSIENQARRKLYFFGITWTEFFLPSIIAIMALFMSVNIAGRLT